nr:hypothetical protein [Tanacetum cinerariifolium]
MKEVRKKSLSDFHKSHPSGSGSVTEKTPSVEKVTGNRYQRKGQNQGQIRQNQAGNEKRGKVNQVKAKVKVKPVKTGHGFGKSTKNLSQRRKYLIGLTHCGDPHETFQCQPMNYYESNPCYDSNYFGFDQIEPLQYSVNQSLIIQNELDHHELFINELIQQKLQNEYAQPFPAIAITFDLPTMEPEDSLRRGDEHLDTIPKIKSNEFIKYSVENLVSSPSESEDLSDSECDLPACDDFTTFSNLLFDADDDFSSSDNESFSDEDISKEIYLNPLFDDEILSIKIDPHHFNAESDLIESLLNHDSSIISYSSKIDSLLDKFAGELTLLKSSPPRIDKTDCDLEEEIHLIEKLLYDNSSPRPPKEFISKNSDDAIESFFPSHIPIEDRLLSNNSLSLPENVSFHFDILSFSRPPAKPPDDDEIKPNSGILIVKMVGDIFEYDVPMPRLLPTQPTLHLNQEESPHLLSHLGLKAFQLPSESPVIDIKEKNKIKAKTGQNQAGNEKRGEVNQVKAKVKVKPVKIGHGFGKSTKNQSRRRKYLIGSTRTRVNGLDQPTYFCKSITPPVTSEGNCDKPGVPDVTKNESTESESETLGNDDDNSNDEEGSERENDSEEHELDSEQDTNGSESDSKSDQQDDDDDEVKDDDEDDD